MRKEYFKNDPVDLFVKHIFLFKIRPLQKTDTKLKRSNDDDRPQTFKKLGILYRIE